jgi:mRNA interferase YafQ
MSSKDKRAALPRASDLTKEFRKDWERLSRSGRFDMKLLKEAMLLLMGNDGPMPPEWRDHPLKGRWSDCRECHIGGDFLLMYRIVARGKEEEVEFLRCGTHADLFGE